MKRRKPVLRTIPDVRAAEGRAVVAEPEKRASYPTVAELAAAPAWRAWLESAIRSVVAPTTVAMIAAAGCAGTDAPTVTPVIAVPQRAPVAKPEPNVPLTFVAPDKVPGYVAPTPTPVPVSTTTTVTPTHHPRPVPHPIAMPGGIRSVAPLPPPPTAAAGGGRPVTPAAAPPSVRGEMRAVSPVTTPTP